MVGKTPDSIASAVAALALAWVVSGCVYGDGKSTSLDPDEFIATARLPEDLRLELAASEPAVVDPIGVTFDADGRMYVVEMGDYPSRPEGSPPLGRVKLLVDGDLDGYYETWTLFADGLQYPTSALPWRDGLLVTQPPDILFLRDTDGDGVADTREALLSGFPVGNTQHNINGLIWGLDNWVYAANGGNHGSGHPAGSPDDAVSIRGMDFRFRPDTRELETSYETSGGHGIAFDAWGRMFGTHNVEHIQHMVFRAAYLARNPLLAVPTTRHMISDHGGSAQLFQISEAETRVNHPEQAGRFSGGSGIAFYGGGRLPAAYDGSFFVNDVVVNVVHQDVVTADGPSFTASRHAEGAELLAGLDNWFRPVTVATGPEGALYVVDMHRAVIEHPEWIPDAVETNLDIRAGDDKGRIYRIVPRAGLPMVRPALASADLPTLVEGLVHPNKWWRDTAQRVLVERGDPTAVPLLRDLLRTTGVALGRLHALWTLRGLGALGVDEIQSALADSSAGVRENTLVLAEAHLRGSAELQSAVAAMADDPDPRVRMQVALTLGGTSGPETREGLKAILRRDAERRWTRYAVLAGLHDGAGDVLRSLLAPETVGQGFGVGPRFGGLGACSKSLDYGLATSGLDRDELGQPAFDPAQFQQFLEAFGHADDAGAATGWVDYGVRHPPAKLQSDLQRHDLFAFGAIRLFQRGQVEEMLLLGHGHRLACGVTDVAIDQVELRAGHKALFQVRIRSILGHEHLDINTATSAICCRGPSGVSRGWHGEPGYA
ncbi:MAG: hypothetical protein IH849_13050 [Acidobacteria bacterium]|nr:hypothetical protein [Acidobacteriota bacterium]